MNESRNDELPMFPSIAPEVFNDPVATKALFAPVFIRLSQVVEIGGDALSNLTPCQAYTVIDLRRHVLVWLQFFAEALNDPAGRSDRIDPDRWDLSPGEEPSAIVARAAAQIDVALDMGVAQEIVVMSQARMTGSSVLAMALGEYLIHGWDLARSIGIDWTVTDKAAIPALEFLAGIVEPEHRGPESGFFDEEVQALPEATGFEQLLCFAGRHLAWTPPPT